MRRRLGTPWARVMVPPSAAAPTRHEADATAPNQYAYTNYKGDAITVRMDGVSIETTSAASITFNINGSTGAAGNTTIRMSAMINAERNDRYTITVTPTGTVSTAYSTF